ncbi:PTS sugar transporter subunit IIA [Erythrobacter sp. 3-20A1M]|uniref:PTS sugar transporter subunit IIA n=1 Tax=Erythrobacter sp. 3-20A1M TaxID=2653850 RepID=UPI001BFCCD02|nr:PTS sugar transporter subunit IIA [Erythrobacter sp. 3-20A1M]QWC56791.1 PTS sugar transporter subunit IIA [Erythrobacter sp. 3-20A1M]
MYPSVRFHPDAVIEAAAGDKPAVLEAVADAMASVYGLDRETVLDSLVEREALGSTGFGNGIAIPHARMEGLERPLAAVIRLDGAVDFAAADAMPVDLVFGLLSPAQAGADHLHALAAISRMVRGEDMRRALIEAPSTEALYALITNATDRDAA